MTIDELRTRLEDAKDEGLVPTSAGDALSQMIDNLLAVAEAGLDIDPSCTTKEFDKALDDLLEE